MQNLVEVKNLKKSYGSKEAVKGISFKIKDDEILGLLGPNGAGKTTTIGMMLGLLKPSNGEIIIDGKKIEDKTELAEAKKTVGQHLIDFAKDLPEGTVTEMGEAGANVLNNVVQILHHIEILSFYFYEITFWEHVHQK